ncbi:MAG: efflux RND transporter periplasmic adaptor subunit [Deltaproteobacteria bacterium]|nr:efflux RND transporter periplasmic adaptor subunit [Deltaproteobacteria bacterium]
MNYSQLTRLLVRLCCLIVFVLWGCDKDKPQVQVSIPALSVTTLQLIAQNTPVDFEFIGIVESPRKVEIRARVEGFLEKRLYREGSMVSSGQALFQLDKKPFEAELQQAKGELSQRQSQLDNAVANLRRVQPLAKKKAVSLKTLDAAINQQKSAVAALSSAQGAVRRAELNLSYTTISAPLAGASGKTLVAEGTFVAPGLNGLLTSVTQIDPIQVSFNVTENILMQVKNQVAKGLLILPDNNLLDVEVVQVDGSVFPQRGRINFMDPVFNSQTGAYEVDAELPNPQRTLRPGQFVRARIKGAFRPGAILVPQSAVTQGAKGPFVWVIDAQKKAQICYVQLGPWHLDQWFVDAGIETGAQIVLDNLKRLAPGKLLKFEPATVHDADRLLRDSVTNDSESQT